MRSMFRSRHSKVAFSLFTGMIGVLSTSRSIEAANQPLAEGGFELPDLGTGRPAYAYNPTGSAWSFLGLSGLAGDNSEFTYLNPPAPEGDQVAFIKGGTGSVVSQTIAYNPGRYRIVLRAAQRMLGTTPNQQVVSIRIDGTEVDQIKPTSTAYSTFTTNTFVLTSGFHSLQLVGTVSQGNNMLFVDDLTIVALTSIAGNWSDATTWGSLGRVPGPNDNIVIPAGNIVRLNTAGIVKTLRVDGELHCADQDISLTAESVMIHGRFECGSTASPLLQQMVLTLTGPVDPTNPFPMGQKVLSAMQSGVIELHGEPRVSWTQLAATAAVGDGSINLSSAVNWRAGDQIVIAPTREVVNQGEVVTISQVLNGGLTVTFSPALAYTHYGSISTYNNNTTTWTLDERAEVGLLTRNIRIEGDASSDASGLGGHMMTMAGTTTHVSGVQFFRMGQKALLGRYPFHWHLVLDAPGQYIKNSSIYRSFNRCVTVHGTNDTLVQDNVCYDFIGHGYFLEDGIEQRNVFDHNLGIWAKKPLPKQNVPDPDLFDSDYRDATASNGPAVFWISHPFNTYTNNAAAGTEGTGYWYDTQNKVGEPSLSWIPGASSVNPSLAPFGVFKNNRVHTGRQGFSSCREASNAFGMEPPGEIWIHGLTVSNMQQAVWPCSPLQDRETHRFTNLIVANSENGMQAPTPMTFQDSLFVAYTANLPPRAQPNGGVDWRAIQVYDQGFNLDNVHFVNYDRPAMAALYPGQGAHKLAKNRTNRVSFANSPNLFKDPDDLSQIGAGPAAWGDLFFDFDGSLVGANQSLVNDHPIMYDSKCTKPTNKVVAGYACPYRYAHIRTEHFSPIAPITVQRSDGTWNTSGHIEERFITETIINGDYHYTYRYTQGIKHRVVQTQLRDAFPGDTQVIEFLDVPATFSILTPGWTQAADLNALFGGPGHSYFYRDHSLFLKLQAGTGPKWHSVDIVDFCTTGSNCTRGPLTLGTLPTVTISSPLDKARVPPTSPLTVTAGITSPNGIRQATLYIGRKSWGTLTTASFTWTVNNLAPGAYPLKVVAEDLLGASFTAVQQLFVGEPIPRVDITSLQDNQTYTQSPGPSLAFSLFNWTLVPGGTHLNWLLNDVDQAALYSTAPITLTNLPQGKNEIELALTQANGTVTAMSDQARLYIVTNNMLADFEDGVDTRGSFTADDTNIGPLSPIGYGWDTADRDASRLDGEDDINYYDITPNGPPYGFATYRLKLDPAQNWAGYTRIRIRAVGLPYTLSIVDASQGTTALGNSTGAITTFNLPTSATLKDQVISLNLRYDESQVTTSPGRQHMYYVELVP